MADGNIQIPQGKIHRRGFLTAGAAAGGGLMIGFSLTDQAAAQEPKATYFQPNAWLKISRDGVVTVVMSYSEMGQGIATSTSLP